VSWYYWLLIAAVLIFATEIFGRWYAKKWPKPTKETLDELERIENGYMKEKK
jgi:hypothetical protein